MKYLYLQGFNKHFRLLQINYYSSGWTTKIKAKCLIFKCLAFILVERLKQRFVEEGFEACMDRKPYPVKQKVKTDGDFEAHLIAISCSESPSGYARWSLRMLADKMVELKYVESISHETIRQVLKKRT